MKYLFKLFHLISGLVIAVAIRVVSPCRNYKFGRLPSHEIGHYASNVEIYLCEKEAKIHGDSKNTIEIWYRNPDYAVANKQLDAMWSRSRRLRSIRQDAATYSIFKIRVKTRRRFS